MARPELSIRINETKYIGSNTVTAEEKKEVTTTVASSTARHEAKHAVIAIKRGRKVKLATVIPGPGYLGMVELDAPDAVAAVAPHATGESGGSHDLHVIEATGHSVAAASVEARDMVARHEESIAAAATLIEAHGSVTGDQITNVIDLTERKRVVITVTDEAGNSEKFDEVAAKDGVVIYSDKWKKIKDLEEEVLDAA
jgi:hypothetical protein